MNDRWSSESGSEADKESTTINHDEAMAKMDEDGDTTATEAETIILLCGVELDDGGLGGFGGLGGLPISSPCWYGY